MILRIGDSGPDVMALQKALGGIIVDGSFGPKTRQAVLDFQATHGLYPDGVVGPLTQAKLSNQNVIPVSPTPTSQILGIDIAHYDTVNDWNQLIPNGWLFCFIKATEGLSTRDAKFGDHWAKSKAHGLLRGAYHYPHFDQDMQDQAHFFVNTINANGGMDDEDMPCVLDWEYRSGDPNHGDEKLARIFLDEVEKLTGKIPIIYSGYPVIDGVNNPSWLIKYPLWHAQYGLHAKVARPWDHYTFWQYSESSHVPGLADTCDANRFAGSLDDLKNLIKKSKV